MFLNSPARCQSCCCIVVVTILVIFTLSLAKMYIGHDVQDEQNELTGIIFLVMLLFFVCLLLFLIRFSVMFFRKRVRGRAAGGSPRGADQPQGRQVCSEGDARPSISDQAATSGVVEPPPYHEALFLPAPPTESPPPSYDKLEVLIHKQ